MITYVERNSWDILKTGKHLEKYCVHHKNGNVTRIMRYDIFDKIPKTVQDFLVTAKLDCKTDLPGDGIKVNRKYERFVKP
ncbi:MAG: hypothetical protein J6Y48_10725 [Clostridia bacterium]|nr:hypothetical protein [Clostridia bacterium]